MERIYTRIASDYERSSHEPFSRVPEGNDPGLLNAVTLGRVGRSSAVGFQEKN